jgi:hypothetical protein
MSRSLVSSLHGRMNIHTLAAALALAGLPVIAQAQGASPAATPSASTINACVLMQKADGDAKASLQANAVGYDQALQAASNKHNTKMLWSRDTNAEVIRYENELDSIGRDAFGALRNLWWATKRRCGRAPRRGTRL